MYDFIAKRESELELKRGEEVKVIMMGNDGWWRGISQSGKSGYFPKTYVKQISQDEKISQPEKIVHSEGNYINKINDKRRSLTMSSILQVENQVEGKVEKKEGIYMTKSEIEKSLKTSEISTNFRKSFVNRNPNSGRPLPKPKAVERTSFKLNETDTFKLKMEEEINSVENKIKIEFDKEVEKIKNEMVRKFEEISKNLVNEKIKELQVKNFSRGEKVMGRMN